MRASWERNAFERETPFCRPEILLGLKVHRMLSFSPSVTSRPFAVRMGTGFNFNLHYYVKTTISSI
ncbi:hypothetical protein MES5069_100021 [Mesorhizobium escarrei]|uniref:Uncharacterized protein n=1 Tax=Mesorhizobium escarrei TaxID=666018 RepID=A0ABM9DFL6_9HYPH|nr:hypothetical protein MES5069_100021 [Mesorhizobium escarrei]